MFGEERAMEGREESKYREIGWGYRKLSSVCGDRGDDRVVGV